MSGMKNVSKTSSKPAGSDGQQSLLQFYKRNSKPSRVASEGSEPPPPDEASHEDLTSPTLGGLSTPVLLPVKAESKLSTPNWSNIRYKFPTPHPGPKESTANVPEILATGKISHKPSLLELESDSLQHPDLPTLQSGINTGETPLSRDVYPIFKRNIPRSLFPRPSTDAADNPLHHSSKGSPRKGQGRPAVSIKKADTGAHGIIDLTESPHHDISSTSVRAIPTPSSPIIIDDVPETRGTQNAPIELSSPPPPKAQKPKMMHPFFTRRETKGDEVAHACRSRLTTSLQMRTPWPDAEMQHNRGPQKLFKSSDSLPFPVYPGPSPPSWHSSQPNMPSLRSCSDTPPLFPEKRTWSPASHVPTPLERKEIFSMIPDFHRKHPGISRIFHMNLEQPDVMAENTEAWAYKWRPRRSAEVLGNEDHLRYIKEWLQALKIRTEQSLKHKHDPNGKSTISFGIRGAKRPIVVRTVEKKHGRKKRKVESDDESSLDGWMVEDGEEESVDESSPEKNPSLELSSPLLQGASRAASPSITVEAEYENLPHRHQPTQFSHLTNTILLTGPSASGKTSAVYACAEELGWEVFEVYPGIGKRSGASISSLVGDVGKNHLVGRRGASRNNATKIPLAQRSPVRSGFGFLTEENSGVDATLDDNSPAVRQSVILLEEVDILFREDANFWPAVVNIIASSHRPVFMTCNDSSLVPVDDLPIQATLLFRPCPPALATSFLQSVCLMEGRVIAREHLDSLYRTTYELIESDQPDIPQVPFPSQAQACSDLRHVLNELQFWCQSQVSRRDDEEGDASGANEVFSINKLSVFEVLGDWSKSPESLDGNSREERISQEYDIFQIWKHSEYASLVDGYLERRSWDVMEALAIDRYGASGDDEVGHELLEKPSVVEHSNNLAFYSKDEVMALEVLVQSRHVFEKSGAGPRARSNLLGNDHRATLGSRSLVRDRATNQMLVASYLDDVMPLSAPLLPRSPTVLEYAAYMRQMVSRDDAMAEKTGSATSAEHGKRGRATRSRWRVGECRQGERYLTLSGKGLEGARKTRLST